MTAEGLPTATACTAWESEARVHLSTRIAFGDGVIWPQVWFAVAGAPRFPDPCILPPRASCDTVPLPVTPQACAGPPGCCPA